MHESPRTEVNLKQVTVWLKRRPWVYLKWAFLLHLPREWQAWLAYKKVSLRSGSGVDRKAVKEVEGWGRPQEVNIRTIQLGSGYTVGQAWWRKLVQSGERLQKEQNFWETELGVSQKELANNSSGLAWELGRWLYCHTKQGRNVFKRWITSSIYVYQMPVRWPWEGLSNQTITLQWMKKVWRTL